MLNFIYGRSTNKQLQYHKFCSSNKNHICAMHMSMICCFLSILGNIDNCELSFPTCSKLHGTYMGMKQCIPNNVFVINFNVSCSTELLSH